MLQRKVLITIIFTTSSITSLLCPPSRALPDAKNNQAVGQSAKLITPDPLRVLNATEGKNLKAIHGKNTFPKLVIEKAKSSLHKASNAIKTGIRKTGLAVGIHVKGLHSGELLQIEKNINKINYNEISVTHLDWKTDKPIGGSTLSLPLTNALKNKAASFNQATPRQTIDGLKNAIALVQKKSKSLQIQRTELPGKSNLYLQFQFDGKTIGTPFKPKNPNLISEKEVETHFINPLIQKMSPQKQQKSTPYISFESQENATVKKEILKPVNPKNFTIDPAFLKPDTSPKDILEAIKKDKEKKAKEKKGQPPFNAGLGEIFKTKQTRLNELIKTLQKTAPVIKAQPTASQPIHRPPSPSPKEIANSNTQSITHDTLPPYTAEEKTPPTVTSKSASAENESITTFTNALKNLFSSKPTIKVVAYPTGKLAKQNLKTLDPSQKLSAPSEKTHLPTLEIHEYPTFD